MKLVTLRSKIKQSQKPQTNIGNTKTIHTHNWFTSFLHPVSKPVLLGVATGIVFTATLATAYGAEQIGSIFEEYETQEMHQDSSANSENGQQTEHTSSQHMPSENGNVQTFSTSGEDLHAQSTANPEECDDDSKTSGTSVTIESTGPGSSNDAEVTINGEKIDMPSNGRVTENIKDDDSRTRIRARVDGNSNSSINISTNSSVEVEED